MKEDKLNKKKTFGVPENYFDNFQDRLFEKIDELEETPILNSLKEKGDGFNIPNEYFKTVYENIEEKTLKTPKVKRLAIANKWIYIGGIAASFLAFLIAYSVITSDTINDKGQIVYDDLQEYLDTDLLSYNSYDLAELLQLETDELNQINSVQFKDEAVIEYLSDQTDTYEDLLYETTVNDND